MKASAFSCSMVVTPHILAGVETDTYTWSQQGSPEICFCTGGNRAFSQGVCDLKTSPDRRGCPVPCLRGNGMRQTECGVGTEEEGCRIKQWCSTQPASSPSLGAHQIKDHVLL